MSGQTAPATAPSSAPPADPLAAAHQDLLNGKYDDALAKYKTVVAQDGKSGEGRAGLVRTYLKRGEIDLALEAASKAVADLPDSVPVHAALGEVYFRQAKMGEAEQEFLRAINTPKPDARAYLGLAILYDAYSMHASARKMLLLAHTLAPTDPDIHKRWIQSRPRSEQIEWLEKRIADAATDDEELRASLRSRLDLLKDREKHPGVYCRLANKLSATEAELKPLMIDNTHISGFGLSVKLNGQSSKLLLDTGASGIFINRRLAQKAGIKPLVTTTYGGIGDKGEGTSYLGYADSIRIGELEFQNCLVEVSDKRSVLGDDGLIGANVFSDYLVTIDFLWQKLRLQELPKRPDGLEAAPTLASSLEDDEDGAESPQRAPQDRYIAPEMKSFTKVFRFGHELLIPTRVGNAPPKLFLIDTGAMFNSISPAAAREVTKIHNDAFTTVTGVSGHVKKVYSADKAMLTFSHFQQENQDLTTFDLSGMSRNTGTEVSGILGFVTLRRFQLKIDYRDGLVDFVYSSGSGK
ncbi:MAG TPA: aspartyl protease family protein [Alphaproteobacteria bacterium]|nr:aspartyl protease family protein [Alphaproteobacteria bacterium]